MSLKLKKCKIGGRTQNCIRFAINGVSVHKASYSNFGKFKLNFADYLVNGQTFYQKQHTTIFENYTVDGERMKKIETQFLVNTQPKLIIYL